MQQKLKKTIAAQYMTAILQQLLLVALLLVLLLFAADVYQKVTTEKNNNYDARAQLAYLANRVEASDRAGCVSVREEECGNILVLTDKTESGDFETRFYLFAGSLVEAYCAAENPMQPDDGTPIGETEVFTVELKEQLLTIQTDCGAISVLLHTNAGT